MRIPSKVILLAVTACVFDAIVRLWFTSLRENGPIVEKSISISSPDAKWQATIERVDNGMGFGMGQIYNEVHIQSPGSPIAGHGDKEISAVFYIESEGTEYDFPTLRWVDPDHILIEYPDLHKPGKAMPQFKGMTIEYRSRPAAPQSPIRRNSP